VAAQELELAARQKALEAGEKLMTEQATHLAKSRAALRKAEEAAAVAAADAAPAAAAAAAGVHSSTSLLNLSRFCQ